MCCEAKRLFFHRCRGAALFCAIQIKMVIEKRAPYFVVEWNAFEKKLLFIMNTIVPKYFVLVVLF